MPYSDLHNQIINLSRYFFSFAILFVLWPRVIFREHSEGGLDGFMSRYVKMTCLLIIVVYLLVIIKLYELISLVTVLLLLTLSPFIFAQKGQGNNLRAVCDNIVRWFYDVVDGQIHPVSLLKRWSCDKIQLFKKIIFHRINGAISLGNTILFVSVFAYSAYLRFYDAIMHAAPAMSDAYVTLAWMKYIERRELFHDGIYPQGFHICLSVLHKIAASDPLYILKYTGPLNGVLITLGIYFFVSRLTGQKTPGIISACLYGIWGGIFTSGWERQASTNSQEFALIFLMPAWYYTVCYFKTKSKVHYWTAAASFAVIGLVHSLVYFFLATGVVLLVLINLTFNFRESVKPACYIGLAGLGTGIISALPVVFGYLMNKQFHSSSAEYLTTEIEAAYPVITSVDKIALGGFLLFFIVWIFSHRTTKNLTTGIFVSLLGFSSFAMYMLLGKLTGNAVLATRMDLLWSLQVPVGIGAGWYALLKLSSLYKRTEIYGIALCFLVTVSLVFYYKPGPLEPYKMQYDSLVEQYLRINGEYRPTEWMVVSEEGYALVLGRGYHLLLSDFINWYDPGSERLVRQVDGVGEILRIPDIFIFKEKAVFRADLESMAPVYEQREKEYQMLDIWIERYKTAHNNMSIYYEDPDVQVFRIHQPKTKEELFKELWEGEGR
ncbi:MAG: hypothetical protein A4E55_00789 [Pelotomaculum sp. PtaU1.Bin035]|nr:MAG: hypothetical protein A4E55_00789 [Pelotomaculum sp. PtaU1.Bin035]